MNARERDICLDEIKTPVLDFGINVRLNLTNIHGRFQYASERSFDTEEIKKIISNLSDQSNGFYKNQNVWDAISHVERARVSNKMRFAVYERDGNKCCKCGATRNLEVDHIIPIAKGGKSTFDNLQTLCHRCNVEKGSKIEYSAVKHLVNKSSYVCPCCNVPMVLRNGRSGKFYGCPNYPKCKQTKKL